MKEKIGDRRVTLLNRQATIKNLPKTSIPLPTELLCLPPNQNLKKNIFVEDLCTKTTSAII